MSENYNAARNSNPRLAESSNRFFFSLNFLSLLKGCTVGGYIFNHLAINSTTALAAEARVNPALPATSVVESMAKWSNLCPHTVVFVLFPFYIGNTKKLQILFKKLEIDLKSCPIIIPPDLIYL